MREFTNWRVLLFRDRDGETKEVHEVARHEREAIERAHARAVIHWPGFRAVAALDLRAEAIATAHRARMREVWA